MQLGVIGVHAGVGNRRVFLGVVTFIAKIMTNIGKLGLEIVKKSCMIITILADLLGRSYTS
ncbi:MAG: hypothetical protein Q8L68_02320 [Methylococcales bacterium]|nr:hypothetical protein [Methylococcales bacterium]